MKAEQLEELTLTDAVRLIRRRELSPVELTHAVLGRIEALDARVNAFITVTAEDALDSARQAERAVASGDVTGPLHGVPLSLKDLIDVGGVSTTAGSKVLADRLADADSTVAARLKGAGAILVGKTNMHELAYGVTSANVHYGPVRNPWDTDKVAGGSSGGSAVSVALSMALGSIGTDTGGSIRIPAALCGLVGLKPTHGRVSGEGIMPLVEAFDTFGPITRTVEDAALMLDVIAGPDQADARTLAAPEFTYRGSLQAGVEGLRMGVPGNAFDRIDADVEKRVRSALDLLKDMGAEIVEVDLGDPGAWEEIFRAIAGREVFALHKEYLERFPDFYGDETKARIEAGRSVTAEDYARAQGQLADVRRHLGDCFSRVDLLALPTIPIPAPTVGQGLVIIDGKEETVLSALTRHTRLASITGVPSISVPCGLTPDDLPVGLQLTGPHFGEETIIRAAFAYERESDVPGPRPIL